MTRRIEVLVFEGCPNVDATLARASAAAAAAGVPADIATVLVDNEDEAIRRRFLGSPTVRVDGIDVDPGAATRDDFGMQCRIYAVDGRFQGLPPDEWITAALRGDAPRTALTTSLSTGGSVDPCCTGRRG
ncbi:MAG TPA: hypothetical protein VNO21_02600 [Polyangiaceae bacterium]|nr:hypothetical protein [Polyangiaceae bacterium]